MNKITISLKLEPWILAALNVIQQRMPFRCHRTAIIEAMLRDGIKAQNIDPDSVEIKTEIERLTRPKGT